MPDSKDFLNPNSMLTPGLAGGMAVSISMPVAMAFGISVKWIVLVVSVLLGLLIIVAIKDSLSFLQRSIYFMLNSLIIFSTALGAGVGIDSPPVPPVQVSLQTPIQSLRISQFLGINNALAGNDDPMPVPDVEDKPVDNPDSLRAEQPAPVVDNSPEPPEHLKSFQQLQKEYQEKLKAYQKRWSW
jgi:hypothetical protein